MGLTVPLPIALLLHMPTMKTPPLPPPLTPLHLLAGIGRTAVGSLSCGLSCGGLGSRQSCQLGTGLSVNGQLGGQLGTVGGLLPGVVNGLLVCLTGRDHPSRQR